MNLGESEVRAAYYCVAEVVRHRQIQGAPIPDAVRRLLEHLKSEFRAPSVPGLPPEAPGAGSEHDQLIDSVEAARILGCSTRHVRRIAADLDAERVAGRWLFHRSTVLEYHHAKGAA